MPFTNLFKSPDVEWLRDASVNLLYLDLSRWSDIKVVDDERVADLLRANPETRGGTPVSLSAGLAIAKRVGAGKLVMGDLLKVGSRTTVTAKVFDVRGGQRIRTTHQESTVQDSLISRFGVLAQDILNVGSASGVNAGAIGTKSTAAYREYLAGVQALNRFDLKGAKPHFLEALKLDSTFALAHYKLAVLVGWDNAADNSKLEHAQLAARFGSSLPARERTLVNALLAFNSQQWGRACEGYGSLVRADSNDVEALYGMGECLWHDNIVEPIGGDTTRLRFRGSWNSAIHMFERTLAVDPTFHLAFQHILDSYLAEGRGGCRPKEPSVLSADNGSTNCADTYATAIRRDGDSLLLVPVSNRDAAALARDVADARRTNARVRNLRQGREAANTWIAAAADEPRAHVALGRIEALLGEIESADTILGKVPISDLSDADVGRVVMARAELSLKRGRDAQFVRIIDSLAASHPKAQAATIVSVTMAALGRMSSLDSLIGTALRSRGAPPSMIPYYLAGPRIMLGVAGDGAADAERVMFNLVSATGGPAARRNATSQIAPTLIFGLRLARASWPPIDSLPDPRALPALALARHDTAMLRSVARSLDSAARVAADSGAVDDGASFVATEAYLALADTSAALAMSRIMLDKSMRQVSLFTQVGNGFVFPLFLYPRTLLLRADLEAAKGDKAVARQFYQRFLTLWAQTDPEFQPIVDRARKALAALGPG